MADLTIREVQRRAYANKVAKGFNTTDVPMEFGLTMEELGEAFSAWRKQRADLGGELADVLIFVAGLAEITGVDLQAEVGRKLALNEARAYEFLPNGTPVKAASARALAARPARLVCSECLTEACFAGVLMCDNARTASVIEVPRDEA